MKFSEKLRRFYQDPFAFVDNINMRRGFVDINYLARSRVLARNALLFSLAMLCGWIICGFDSSPMQLIRAATEALPGFIMGRAPWADIVASYNFYYGKEVHYSAFVFYGLAYWALSTHFDQGLEAWFYGAWLRLLGPGKLSQEDLALWKKPTGLGISKSRNVVFSVCLTLLAIGTFEMYWILSFGFWQNQPWIYTWRWPQARTLAQNLIFIVVGIFGAFYMWLDSHILENGQVAGRSFRFRVDRNLCMLVAITAILAMVWWFYPWPTQRLTVQLSIGSWSSTPYFPQTLYTVNLNPGGPINAGTWFYIPNDDIHLLNTILKAFWTLSIIYLGLVRRVVWRDELEKMRYCACGSAKASPSLADYMLRPYACCACDIGLCCFRNMR